MKKRVLAAMMACAMAAGLLSGCSSEPKNPGDSNEPVTTAAAGQTEVGDATAAAQEESGPKIFHDYMTTDVDTINPHIYTMSVSGDVIARTSLQLYRQYPNAEGTSFEYFPELAEKEPEKADEEGKVWRIKIRENAKWENGDAIDVDDVIYSFKMCLDPLMVNSRASQLASDYITITKASDYSLQGNAGTVAWEDVGIKKADDYTLELQLYAPVTEEDIKAHFNYVWTCLVHEPTYEACMSEDRSTNTYGSTREKYMSCGAFILDQWIAGSQFDMKKNPDFVLGDKIKLDGYNYKIVGDRNTALELYLNGELDAVSLSPESIEQYIDDPSIKKAPATSIQTLTINHGNTNNNGILGNLNFRKALFYAIDRESIAKMTNGIPANYLVASKCLGLDGQAYRDMEESQALLEPNLGYDSAKAKEFYDKALEECGLTSLTLTLQYNETSANNKAASEFLHKSLPEVFGDSFTLELMAGSTSVLNSYIKGWKEGDPNSFELQWRGWNTSTAAPWNGLKVYSSMYSNKNEPYYNDEFDALWEKANYDIEAKLDPAYRMDLTRQMEKIVLDEVAACPVYEAPSYNLISSKIHLVCDEYIPGYGFGYILSTKD
ncbi:MAG: hypothetical protein KHZ10_10330 [Clostridium sp.]|nr:hypothetical protein [Clostridium sp.]